MAKKICAWCKKDIEETSGDSDSHGICDNCLEAYFGPKVETITTGEQLEIFNGEARGHTRVDPKKAK
jgi:hypothetical protein